MMSVGNAIRVSQPEYVLHYTTTVTNFYNSKLCCQLSRGSYTQNARLLRRDRDPESTGGITQKLFANKTKNHEKITGLTRVQGATSRFVHLAKSP